MKKLLIIALLALTAGCTKEVEVEKIVYQDKIVEVKVEVEKIVTVVETIDNTDYETITQLIARINELLADVSNLQEQLNDPSLANMNADLKRQQEILALSVFYDWDITYLWPRGYNDLTSLYNRVFRSYIVNIGRPKKVGYESAGFRHIIGHPSAFSLQLSWKDGEIDTVYPHPLNRGNKIYRFGIGNPRQSVVNDQIESYFFENAGQLSIALIEFMENN